MTILVDIDNTITNFSEALLNYLNNFPLCLTNPYPHHSYEEITSYDWFDKTYNYPWYATEYEHFWNMVKINPEAISTLEQWVKQGHQVYLVTASHFNNALGYKIRKTLEPFNPELINERNVIIAQDKSAIIGDVMIDDCIDNLTNFEGVRICYTQPWNQNFKEVFRYNDWNKIDSVIQGFSRFPWYRQK